MKKKLIPEKELYPSTHQERAKLNKEITSGKLRDEVLKKVVSKQKVLEIKKPAAQGMNR